MASAARIEPTLIAALKERLAVERGRLERGLREKVLPTSGGRELVEAITSLVDGIILELAEEAKRRVGELHGAAALSAVERVALVGLGGYGRRELAPRSDIDLLFLLPKGAASTHVESFVDMVLYGLWDLGFDVGHAARTVDECLEIAAGDQSVKTALVDARLLTRDAALFQDLERAFEREMLSGRATEIFIGQKLEEAEARRARYGGTIFMLEPDVKSSEGGLRELHTALWIARARFKARTAVDLLKIGVLSPRELRALERAFGFLLRVRAELHFASKRRRDGLGFEYQEAIAATLGYVRPGGERNEQARRRHGTERFMRAYYFHARHNRRISQLIVERATSHPVKRPARATSAPGGFKTFAGMLTVAERDQFERDPAALVRIFRVAQEEALEIYSYTKDLIGESVLRLDKGMRRDPEVVGDFLGLLEDPRSDGAILELMHDLGVLRRIVPELTRVTAHWQHSLYHVYTVDVHSLFVVKTLKALRAGKLAQEHPELTRLISDLPRPQVLYMAGFLHDIGKGWKRGDHSVRGEVVSRVVGARFEEAKLPTWTHEDTQDLAWLVREHLLMSDISQRRDLSDADLVAGFAARCGSLERLTMLYVLTFGDMKATSPKVWSDWKGVLLSDLYEKTRAALAEASRGGARAAIERRIEARRQRAVAEILEAAEEKKLSGVTPALAEAFVRAMPDRYLLSMPGRGMARHIEPWKEVSERGGLSVRIRHLRREGVTRLTLVCPDRPGLLALLAGTLTANRLTIESAQIFSIALHPDKDGWSGTAALDILHLRDAGGEICEDAARWEQVREDLKAVILRSARVEGLLEKRVGGSTLAKRPRPRVDTKIVVSPDASKHETVIDVFCQDHLGALYTISRALADQGLTISLAKISTQGDRVADGFYVSDAATSRKIDDEKRLARVVDALRSAIEASVAASS